MGESKGLALEFLICHKVKVKFLSHVRLFVTPWTVAHQAPPPMEFSRQEYWSGLPFPSPRDFPDPGIFLSLRKFMIIRICIHDHNQNKEINQRTGLF